MKYHRIRATSLFLGLALLTGLSHAEPINVVTSIKPLELLVRAVATEGTNVTTLVPAGSSPHTYHMRPSERRAMDEADLIFWVGPDMETFLTRILGGEDFEHRTHALSALAPSATTEVPHPNEHEGKDDAHQEEQDTDGDHDGHEHGDGEDPHIWLDPALAMQMAATIHDRLAEQPGADKSQLKQNLDAFRQALGTREDAIRQQLKAAEGISLFTYHDAFGRFAAHYGLAIAGVLTPSPERSPGARHVAEVQNTLKASSQPCLLIEPQFDRDWWRAITEGVEARLSTWDPLASDITADADGYLNFQQQLADAVMACLPG
ncbi:zinc ABC transporter substrate-binding protein [Marinobacter changyiensis]|uniref:zinc ABC transporter substrate-binding protein n=1 Tax=Marinobacter changyiensis TaxID=2604091 RepID=UPI00126407CC|nr:zinc ABC transporter substrate-binding protein [Marinobacter changyiensis]